MPDVQPNPEPPKPEELGQRALEGAKALYMRLFPALKPEPPVKLQELTAEQLTGLTRWAGTGEEGDASKQGLLERLQHADFRTRERASADIQKLGVAALPHLQAALRDGKLELEARRRVENIISGITGIKLIPQGANGPVGDDVPLAGRAGAMVGAMAAGALGGLGGLVPNNILQAPREGRISLELKAESAEKFATNPELTQARIEVDRQLLELHRQKKIALSQDSLDLIQKELKELRNIKTLAAEGQLRLAMEYGREDITKATASILKAMKLDPRHSNSENTAHFIVYLGLDQDQAFMKSFKDAGGSTDKVDKAVKERNERRQRRENQQNGFMEIPPIPGQAPPPPQAPQPLQRAVPRPPGN